MDRREFVQTSAAVAVASRLPLRLPQADASIRDLCMRALNAAKTAGASYADVRVGRTAVNNFRFNESPVTMLNNLVAVGRPERVSSSESGDVGGLAVVVPPLVVRDFSFTSASEAV
jgi:predicted Zn-dependent protease